MTHEELKNSRIALQRAKKENESGRSMVEMLGVLAIVGVLSVVGVSGFKMAMDKHRTNELLNGASLRFVVATAQLAQGKDVSEIGFATFTDNTIGGATFGTSALVVPDSPGKFGIKISNVEKAVCQNLIDMAGGSMVVAKAETPGTPMTASECSDNKEQNILAFIYDTGAGSTTPTPYDWGNPDEWEPSEDYEIRCQNGVEYGSMSGQQWEATRQCRSGCDIQGRDCKSVCFKEGGEWYYGGYYDSILNERCEYGCDSNGCLMGSCGSCGNYCGYDPGNYCGYSTGNYCGYSTGNETGNETSNQGCYYDCGYYYYNGLYCPNGCYDCGCFEGCQSIDTWWRYDGKICPNGCYSGGCISSSSGYYAGCKYFSGNYYYNGLYCPEGCDSNGCTSSGSSCGYDNYCGGSYCGY